MVSPLKILFPVFLSLSFLTGCFDAGGTSNANYSSYIDQVRQKVSDQQTNAELVDNLAGRHGKVTWSAEGWGAGVESNQLILVSAKIQKNMDGIERELELQYRYDLTSQDVVLDKVLLDGQKQSVIGGAVAMLAMKLE